MHPDFRLGDIEVLVSENRIRRETGVVQVEPKVMEVLVCLAEADSVVQRDALMRRVWGDVVVTEHVLSRCISELRKALGDDPRAPRFVETIRRRGYRLIPRPAPAAVPAGVPETARRSAVAPARRPRRGLPVLATLAAAALILVWLVTAPTPEPLLRELPITSYPGSELDPALSPDGVRVAFAWAGPDGENFDIYQKELSAEQPIRLTRHPGEDKNPTWSPDGDRIAFVRSWIEGSGLYVVPASGGEELLMLATVSGDIPDLIWSPDGNALYHVDRPSPAEPFAVFRLDLATFQRTRLTGPPAHHFGDRDLALSPDGEWLAFARAELGGVEDLFVMESAGGEPRRLTGDRSSITGIEWIGGGREILFSSDRIDATRLWRLPRTGGAPRPVPGFGERASDPDLAPSRGLLAYERRTYETNIWRKSRGPDGRWSDAAPFLTSTRTDSAPSYSPDGNHIAFVSDRAGPAEIWLCDPDGDRLRRLAEISSSYPEVLDWSPDSSRIAFIGHDERRQPNIVVVAIASGAIRQVTGTSDLKIAPRWSADGDSIYFGSNRTGDWQIWRAGLQDGTLEQVTGDGGMAAAESGGWLYLLRPQANGLYRRPIGGGEFERVVDVPEPTHWLDFSLARRGIFFGGGPATPSGTPVMFFDFAASSRAEIGDLTLDRPYTPRLGFSVSPDGNAVLFTMFSMSDSDLLMVDGFR